MKKLAVRKSPADSVSEEERIALGRREIYKSRGELVTLQTKSLMETGDMLAKREKYKLLAGIDAVKYYLMQKHHWLPSQINAMTVADLDFAVSEENDDAAQMGQMFKEFFAACRLPGPVGVVH